MGVWNELTIDYVVDQVSRSPLCLALVHLVTSQALVCSFPVHSSRTWMGRTNLGPSTERYYIYIHDEISRRISLYVVENPLPCVKMLIREVRTLLGVYWALFTHKPLYFVRIPRDPSTGTDSGYMPSCVLYRPDHRCYSS